MATYGNSLQLVDIKTLRIGVTDASVFFLCFCKSGELGGSKTASQCSCITDAVTLAEPAALQTKCTCRPETLLKFCIIKDATNGQINKETLMTQD